MYEASENKYTLQKKFYKWNKLSTECLPCSLKMMKKRMGLNEKCCQINGSLLRKFMLFGSNNGGNGFINTYTQYKAK